jgi:oxygen-dependent protoporphyrinogen oxidase
MKPLRVIVIGGGIAGLSCAHRLKREALARGRALELQVLEADERAGGHVRTVHERGFVVEAGPNGFLDRVPAARAMVDELGLAGELVEAQPAAKRRFLLRRGRLRRVPDGPKGFLTGDVLSPLGKARVLLEPWARRAPAGREETVEEFAQRRIGSEAAAVLVDAAVAGITAGDPRRLSLPAAFPQMNAMEKEHGSLVRALFARRGAGVRPARLVSFRDGMETAVLALARDLGDALRLASPVRALEGGLGGWRVRDANGRAFEADHVVCALPGSGAARLLEPLDDAAARALSGTPFASVAVVGLGVEASRLPVELDGYGYLVPRGEGFTTLGVVRDSALFPNRAPSGAALLRVVLGGPRDPAIATRPDDELVALARRELDLVVGGIGEPLGSWVFRRPFAIAQYVLGHQERTARARAHLTRHAGLHLCGTSYDGVSFGGAIASGRETADRVLAEAS